MASPDCNIVDAPNYEAEEVTLYDAEESVLDCQTIQQVVQFEAVMGGLEEALQQHDAPKAGAFMQAAREGCQLLQGLQGAEALLEAGQYDRTRRERLVERAAAQLKASADPDPLPHFAREETQTTAGSLEPPALPASEPSTAESLADPVVKRREVTAGALDSAAIWKAMQYEDHAGRLQDAMSEAHHREAHQREVHLLMDAVRAASQELLDDAKAHQILEAGRFNFAARDNMRSVYRTTCCETHASEKVLGSSLLLNPPASPAPGAGPLGSLLHGDPHRRMAQQSAALRLRGGGPFDCGYGACSGSGARDANAEPTMYENLQRGGSLWQLPADRYKHDRELQKVVPPVRKKPTPGFFVRLHDFFENPIVAFGLISIDLGCTIASMFSHVSFLSEVSLAILAIMLFQQVLDIIMVACPVTHYLIDQQCVYVTDQFEADCGPHHPPITIGQGLAGQVDMVTTAAWNSKSYGAYVNFTDIESDKVFVTESKWENLQVTFSFCTYFTNPVNLFNIGLLAFCLYISLHGSSGCTGILIVLRFTKPVLKAYGKVKKVREFYEAAAGGEEAEEAVLVGGAIVEAEKIDP